MTAPLSERLQQIRDRAVFHINRVLPTDAHLAGETLDEAIRTLAVTGAENTRLRPALATSQDPCVYCQLPAEEMAKCKAGFPGCARMDDLVGCPEFGAAMELHDVRAALNRAHQVLQDWLALADRAVAQFGVDPHPEEARLIERARAELTDA